MHERIRKLRRTLDLTQQEFAEKIGSKRNTVAKYETAANAPSAAVVSLICREFNVNEEWLRTGKGDMFNPEPADELDLLAKKYQLSNADYSMIKEFVNLKPEIRQAIFNYISNVKFLFENGKMDPLAMASKEKENATPKMSVEEAETEYIKSRSISARNTESSALNTTGDTKKAASE